MQNNLLAIWLITPSFFILIAHIYFSAWLYGRKLYFSTLLFGFLFISGFFIKNNDLNNYIWLFILCLFYFYFISTKYITETKFLDIRYQSHDKLVEYISGKEEKTVLDNFIIKLGPLLLGLVLLMTFYHLFINFSVQNEL